MRRNRRTILFIEELGTYISTKMKTDFYKSCALRYRTKFHESSHDLALQRAPHL